jgi:hypothetical protein
MVLWYDDLVDPLHEDNIGYLLFVHLRVEDSFYHGPKSCLAPVDEAPCDARFHT